MASIDKNQLLLLAGSDLASLKEIVLLFRDDALANLAACAASARHGDVNRCSSLVHKLKGSSGSLGFTQLYEVCVELEKLGSCDSYLGQIGQLEILVDDSVEQALEVLG